MSRAEATASLCRGVENADRAVVAGDFLTGGVRLAGAIGSYGAAADPTVASGARQMLGAGMAYDPDGYVTARAATAAACARAGYPITVGGIPCSQLPCP